MNTGFGVAEGLCYLKTPWGLPGESFLKSRTPGLKSWAFAAGGDPGQVPAFSGSQFCLVGWNMERREGLALE